MATMRLLTLTAGFALACLTAPTAGAQPSPASPSAADSAERPWAIVTLIGGNLLTPANVALDGAMRKVLNEPGRHPVDFFSEALDALRFPQAQLEDEIVALLAKKYATTHIDAVITLGAPALFFAEKHRNRIWPNARILFQAVPIERLGERGPLSPTTTGIPIQWEAGGTVDVALALRPGTRRLVVIYGSGDFDRAVARVARKQLERFSPRLDIEYWTDASIEEFTRKVAQLSPDDAVLYLSVARDAGGRTFVAPDVAERLSSASPAPFFGPFETFLGRGTVAGMVNRYETVGARMGELVAQALSDPTKSIPLVTMTGSSCVADARQLERFGMAESSLPAGCDIRFATRSVWHEYRWYIAGAIAALLAQSALIMGLFFQRRARRKAEVEARQRRVELAHASRLALAGELTASIAHEINQPLGAILANAGAAEALLRRGNASQDELGAIIADIKRADLRASEVIRRVRALVTSRQSEHTVEDLNSIIDDVLGFLRGEAERRGVAIETKFDPQLPRLAIDRVQLQQAITNLCINAMDAMAGTAQGRRRLGVRTAARGDGDIEIVVTDTGPGIPPEQLPRLFESFFTTKAEGMGLGLSISRSIVDAHDGTLAAENIVAGGALFRIVLPAAPDVPSPPKKAEEQRGGSQ
jgi:signal transduction histidine kinase